MIHTIDKNRRLGGKSQRINSPSSMRKAEDYVKKEKIINKETGEIIEKTNRKLWYSSTGVVDEFARQCMRLQKQQGYAFKEGDKRLMVHQIQSFDKRDNKENGGTLTPEKAHKIGVELVQKSYPNYQVLVVTHYNTEYIHNHILINGVANPTQNHDGSFQKPHKFQDGNNAYRYENEHSLTEIKMVDESLCKAYGLTYSTTCYQKKKGNKDLRKEGSKKIQPSLESYKEKIDKAISICNRFDLKEFKNVLKKTFGIDTKIDNSRNSITYKSENEKIKKVSGKKLGQGYRLEDINERLCNLKATAKTTERKFDGGNRVSKEQSIRAEFENRRTKNAAGRTESGKQEFNSGETTTPKEVGRKATKPKRG